MLVLLPPSETKRDGGAAGTSLDLAAMRFPELDRERRQAIAALKRLSRSVGDSTVALGLGPTQRFEIDRNRALSTSPTMAAMDRFTGVLYEALAAPGLPLAARDWLARHAVIQSALLGPIGAGDAVPAYRLSHDSRLPGIRSPEPGTRLVKHWADAAAAVIARHDGLILDLRSEGYAALGPVPVRDDVRYLRVLAEGPTGTRRALNHFNKKGKGEFVRALALDGVDVDTVDEVLAWAEARGIRLEQSETPTDLDLVV